MKTRRFFKVLSVLSSLMITSTFSMQAFANSAKIDRRPTVSLIEYSQDVIKVPSAEMILKQVAKKERQPAQEVNALTLDDQEVEVVKPTQEIDQGTFDDQEVEVAKPTQDIDQGTFDDQEVEDVISVDNQINQLTLDDQPSIEEVAQNILSDEAQLNESSASTFDDVAIFDSLEADLDANVEQIAQSSEEILAQAGQEAISEEQAADLEIAIDQQEDQVEQLAQAVDSNSEISQTQSEKLKEELAQAKIDLAQAKEALNKANEKVETATQYRYKLEKVTCELLNQNEELEANIENKIAQMMNPMMQQMQMMQQLIMMNRLFDPGYTSSNSSSMFGLDYGYEMLKLNQLFNNQSQAGVTNNYYFGGDYLGATMPTHQPVLQNDLRYKEMMLRNQMLSPSVNFSSHAPMLGNFIGNNPNIMSTAISPTVGINSSARFGNITPSTQTQMPQGPAPAANTSAQSVGGIQPTGNMLR